MNEAMERLKSRQSRTAPQGMDVLTAIMQPRPASQGDIVQIPGGKLHSFSGHTFKLRPDDDPYMLSLLESIRENGILEPLLVRPHPAAAGEYEIIAGHTRHYLGDKAGLTVFPCVIRTLDDAEAVIQMGESNVQRPDWLPSEKARTYKAHLEAIREKRRGKQEPGSCFPDSGTNQEPGSWFAQRGNGQIRDLAAQRWGITGKALELYIKLNDLSPVLLDMVDGGRIPVKAGFQLAFLPEEYQSALGNLLMTHPNVKVNEAQAKELRQLKPDDFPYVLGLWSRSAKRPTWNVALPRDLLPEGAKAHLADPELQRRIAAVVRDYVESITRKEPTL